MDRNFAKVRVLTGKEQDLGPDKEGVRDMFENLKLLDIPGSSRPAEAVLSFARGD